MGQHGEQPDAVRADGLPEQRRDAPMVFTGLQNLFPKIIKAGTGNLRKRHGIAVANGIGGPGFH
jgi:hypothetical protein